jgi:hypothetical protein
VPVWFQRTADQIVIASPAKAPKLKALAVPEYALAAVRYFGREQGGAWVDSLRGKPMARIAITPSWVGILDFQTRFPSAMTAL